MATETQDPPITQGEREETADFDPATNGNGATPTNPGRPEGEVEEEKVRSMADIEAAAAAERAAAAAQVGEEPDGQLFVIENSKRVSLGTLYARNTPVEFEFKLGSKGIKGSDSTSLIAFSDPELTLIVPCRAGKTEVDPTYNPDGTVKKVVIRQNMKPITAYDARSEAGRVALTGE